MLSLIAGASLQAIALLAPLSPEEDQHRPDIVVTGRTDPEPSRASADAATIATRVNAVNVEDMIKYLPSLIVRKRHIGDTQAPVATRTSGLGASARSLVYADGALLSALIGNNNTTASPRWGLVSTQEIARIDVLYGPYSAAYPGNSMGAVIEITTRLPERLEATAKAGVNLQRFQKYGTDRALPSYQLAGTIGDRFGDLALFASADHIASDGQPIGFATLARPAASGAGSPANGGYDDLNRSGAPIRVLGATAFEHQVQDRLKLTAALDLTPSLRVAYTGAVFMGRTDADSETYLRNVAGAPVYAGTANLDGRAYAIPASAFANGVYRIDQRHWSHALSIEEKGALAWKLIATRYRFAKDVQRTAGSALPGARAGGAGTITRLDGTGWDTLDASASWHGGAHALRVGGHLDRFELASNRYAATDWRRGAAGAPLLRSLGVTRTAALWAEDAWSPAPALTLTLGGRYEWWRAFGGRNVSASPALGVDQPERRAARFSPKAALAWRIGSGWTVRASYGRAWRFPTVSELYQVVTSPVPAVPDPDLRPERGDSVELAIEHRDAHGTLRAALFGEEVADALVSQGGPLNGTATFANFVQNVERTRTRGVELSFDRRDVLSRLDLAGSLTYADAQTSANPVQPASVGKLIPGVPHWKATLLATWLPDEAVSLTAAGRYTSRIFGTLDNSDSVGDTYQGFDRYLVVDLRAQIRAGARLTLGLGIDNLLNERYFLFHPFPQRAVAADMTFRF